PGGRGLVRLPRRAIARRRDIFGGDFRGGVRRTFIGGGAARQGSEAAERLKIFGADSGERDAHAHAVLRGAHLSHDMQGSVTRPEGKVHIGADWKGRKHLDIAAAEGYVRDGAGDLRRIPADGYLAGGTAGVARKFTALAADPYGWARGAAIRLRRRYEYRWRGGIVSVRFPAFRRDAPDVFSGFEAAHAGAAGIRAAIPRKPLNAEPRLLALKINFDFLSWLEEIPQRLEPSPAATDIAGFGVDGERLAGRIESGHLHRKTHRDPRLASAHHSVSMGLVHNRLAKRG